MANDVVSLSRSSGESTGRETELSVLLREHDEARNLARARFAFVRGPRGVGKSHLLRLARQALAARAVNVFEAESGRDVRRPYVAFATVVSEILEHLSHQGVPPVQLAPLGRRVAPVGGPYSGAAADGARVDLFDAVCELFILAGRSHPVFLFPDLDAADKASLELFRYLAAVVSAPESRAGGLFVASFRDEVDPPAPLRDVLGKVSARTLPLTGFDLDGIRGFLLRTEVAQRLYEATGGMPDALEEMLAHPSPRPVELFLRRVQRQSESARAVLSVLAASNDALPLDAVAGTLVALGHSPASVATDLDALAREHMLAVKVVGGVAVYRFARERDRDAFRAEMPPSSLAEARCALGRFLAGTGDRAAAAALLLEAAPKEGAALAIEAAGDLSARGALEDAVDLLERALPLVVEGSVRAQVHRKLHDIHVERGEFRRALRHLSRARVRGDAAALADLAPLAAKTLIALGRLRPAERMLARMERSEDAEQRAMARAHRVEMALLRGRPDEAIGRAQDALSIESTPVVVLALRNALGRAWFLKGDLANADEAFEQNATLGRACGLATEEARALGNRGVVAHKLGDRERAIRFYQAALAGDRSVQARNEANLGSLHADAGEFEPALEHLSRALQSFSRLASAREVAHAACNLARVYNILGELPRAFELASFARERAREIGERYLVANALLILGEVQLDRSDPHDATRLLGEARALFELVGNEGYAALAAALKGRAHLMLGERAQASGELSRPFMDRGCADLPAAQIETELARGELALGLGDLQGATRAVTRAREALLHKPDLEGPYRVYFLMGRLRLAAGDTSGAQAEMARAARLLDELTQRVPPARRKDFLSVPRRAEVLAAAEPDLRLPRATTVLPSVSSSAHGLVGRSAALARITRQIEPIARSNATVLIRGESGTGKELLAQAIHDLSPRRAMPIVKVNCAAMVEELLLSELFGHEKGAFTGAVRERKGRFELADGGTLFLDEIGDISPKAQVSLLRVLQEREFERVGGTRTIKVDVRVICATNRDLEALITQGRFRQDLYYRLKGVMLELPALRERLEDLPYLAAHFLARVARERNEAPKQLTPDALELLGRHSWPGNVRELENVLASAAIFADGSLITPECFMHVHELAALLDVHPTYANGKAAPLPPTQPEADERVALGSEDEEDDDALEAPSGNGSSVEDVDFYELARSRGLSLKELRQQLEMQCIRRALIDAGGNISEAARLLKMKRSRLSQIVNAEPDLRSCRGD